MSSTDDSDICLETVYHKARATEHDTNPAKLAMRNMRTSPHPRTISLSPEKPTSPRVPTSTFLKHYYKHSQLILFVLIYSFLIYPTHFHIVVGARNKCPVPPYHTTKLHSFQSKDTAAQIIIKPQKKNKIKKPYKITFCHAGRKQRQIHNIFIH